MGSTVKDAQQILDKKLDLPGGYYYKWAGQFESQKEANIKLAIILPITLSLIVLLLFLSYKDWACVLIVMSSIVVSTVGCVLALTFTGTYFSISAGAGFIAAIGVSIQNASIILSSLIKHVGMYGESLDSVIKGSVQKLRPVLIAASIVVIGLFPASISKGIGAQSQKPFAIAIMGGVALGTAFMIFLIPVLFQKLKIKKYKIIGVNLENG